MKIREFLERAGLDSSLAPAFEALAVRTLAWNKKINVTAIREPEAFMEHNVMDSLTLVGASELEKSETVCDLGTGGGYPGLPLALVYPGKNFLLIDSAAKKLEVIRYIAEELAAENPAWALGNVALLNARAEEAGREPDLRESFDLVLSRAVANLSVLAEYCLPLVRRGGSFIAYKTEAASDEIGSAKGAIEKLGGRLKELRPNGMEESGRIFVIIEKCMTTPEIYPRRPGLPAKRPLI